jgi:N6-adenosine-specific RNA methylase IME4
MSQAELAALPVGKLGAENAHLYLWTTDAHLEEALYLMKVWRFTYKQNLVWVKQNAKLQIGLGNYYRHAHELCLFGVRGKAPARSHSLPSVLLALRETFAVAGLGGDPFTWTLHRTFRPPTPREMVYMG